MPAAKQNKFLVWGAGGWIGGQMIDLLKQQGKTVLGTTIRMEEQQEVRECLDTIKPSHVINCAGKTGRPNVDWCEDHKIETMQANGLGALILTNECYTRGIHLTHLATGCIYTSTYTPDYTKVLSAPFKETDRPNFTGSFYSATKAPIETFLKNFPQTLILRLRMPVSADLHPRSFVTKISTYKKVVNVPNSHSLLPDLLPIAIAMSEHREEGVYNFTNPGEAISHNEVLRLYREILAPGYAWENFTLEEQARVIKAERSNCWLDAGKLAEKVREYREEGCEVELVEVREAYRRCFEKIREDGGRQSRAGADGVAVVEGDDVKMPDAKRQKVREEEEEKVVVE
ncbi:uncharacterized protein MYCFIDRAFT_34055 [Pseudocercospora fijiensis CIRAD86]|uniref:RmlD-like substrate binding domain-containing protein n=1 Tax=Pseudocercospora fijiensis (strain CIRAD86) TaxID=383855 RepID=M3APZ8_PSEFD|nr:uncharacterized protein MYCFIDRAFT_34055 [Pseudocercospora fijiensis CIRAD86]EME79517.1 hypothetical protein MYCFIDRAFT_34055 [Pseudocercospora fijiensis CIRAD86]